MTDLRYQTFDYRFTNGGICARDVYDKMRPGSYRDLQNLESRSEGALSSRYGMQLLTTDGNVGHSLNGEVVNLGRMRGLGNPYNYAGTSNGILYRKGIDGIGAYAQIFSGLSGASMSMYPYRPDASSAPWMFFADSGKMLKDNGTIVAPQNWGITPPLVPALIAPTVSGLTTIEGFQERDGLSSFTTANISGGAMVIRFQAMMNSISAGSAQIVRDQLLTATNLSRVGNVTTVTTSVPHNYVSGMRVAVSNAAADVTFQTASAVITITGAKTFTYPNQGLNHAIASANISALPSVTVGMLVLIADGVDTETVLVLETTANGWVGNFLHSHNAGTFASDQYASGTVAANQTGSISKSGAFNLSFSNIQQSPEDDLIQIYVLLDQPLAVKEIRILFDVGDGSFSQDYYYKSMVMSAAQPAVAGNVASDVAQSGAVFRRAGGGLDPRTPGGNNPSLLPSDLPLLQQMQPSAITPGANVWTLFQARIGDFVAVGAAGNAGNDWTNVGRWRVQITTNPNTSVSFGIDDLIFIGGSDLDSFGGQSYDYRYTYYNALTGCESNPSQILIATDPATFDSYYGAYLPVPLAVQREAITVKMKQTSDLQVTHFRVYRRGGTLTQGWYMVAQVAGGSTDGPPGSVTFVDTVADSIILVNPLLNVNADAPCTTLLPAPLNTTLHNSGTLASLGPGPVAGFIQSGSVKVGQTVTIGDPGTQETVYVQSVIGNAVSYYAQLNHGTPIGGGQISTPLTATSTSQTAMNLMAIAFDKVWLAGDPNNPHILYYSTTFQPETFPQQNFIEIGTPDAPIMALVELNGQLYVFTTKRVYQILGAGSSVPISIPTPVKHGLSASFAWCAAENVIYYLSYDGIYAFSGGAAAYLSEPVEWLLTGKSLGPIEPFDPSNFASVRMAYCNHEVFILYTGVLGGVRRLIYHDVYRRWRDDMIPVGENRTRSMYFAEDIGVLFVGRAGGNVYQDRVLDYDQIASGSNLAAFPIPYVLQTSQMDQSEASPDNAKKFKVYNQVTIDADLNSQTANVAVIFDSGNTMVSLGTITGNGTGRQQFQLNINNGEGYESLNIGLLITGQTTVAVTFFETHVRALPIAEARRSWDTWWVGYGTDEWHLYKQIFAMYKTSGAPITVNAFTDGNMNSPAFSFILPSTGGVGQAVSTIVLQDSNSVLWQVQLLDSGIFQNTSGVSGTPQVININDSVTATSYLLGITIGGQLRLTQVTYNAGYPTVIGLVTVGGLFSNMTVVSGAIQKSDPLVGAGAPQSQKVRFPATKCRLIRFIGTSTTDFFMYPDTQIEHKKLGSAKGYERGQISP